MKRNLVIAILVPCILTCILIILIILDNRNSSPDTYSQLPDEEQIEDQITPIASSDPSQIPEEEQTDYDTAEPTTVPDNTSSKTPTPSPTLVPATDQAPTEPSEQNNVTEPGASDDYAPSPVPADTYNALYSQKGDGFTLVADSITKSFLFIDNEDGTIRRTDYTYSEKYEQYPQDKHGPVLGYINGVFVFAAKNYIVASDGITDTILISFENNGIPDDVDINPLLYSDSRILAGVGGVLIVIDTKTLAVETYTEHFSPEFFVFTDEYLCFSSKRKIPEGPYYNYLYAGRDGNAVLLGSIGEIDEYALDNNVVFIKSGDSLYQIDLAANELTSSYGTARERTLYFPVYGDGIVSGLKEIRFINYNDAEKPVQSIMLPDKWEAECYYSTYYNAIIYSIADKTTAGVYPNDICGRFTVIDYSVFPLENGKFPTNSKVKEELYKGKTFIGEGEIYILEIFETVNNNSVLFEVVYAWIPALEESRAYQLYFYVPRGDDAAKFVDLTRQFLQMD